MVVVVWSVVFEKCIGVCGVCFGELYDLVDLGLFGFWCDVERGFVMFFYFVDDVVYVYCLVVEYCCYVGWKIVLVDIDGELVGKVMVC